MGRDRSVADRGRAFSRREEGQAAFEFVLVFPLFIIMLLLILDFGILMYEYVSVSNAAREGARFAAVNCADKPPYTPACDVKAVQDRVVERSGGILKSNRDCSVAPTKASEPDMVCVQWIVPSAPSATPVARSGQPLRGDTAVVSVKHVYGFLFLPFDFPVASCAGMRLERTEPKASTPPPSGPLTC